MSNTLMLRFSSVFLQKLCCMCVIVLRAINIYKMAKRSAQENMHHVIEK